MIRVADANETSGEDVVELLGSLVGESSLRIPKLSQARNVVIMVEYIRNVRVFKTQRTTDELRTGHAVPHPL